MTEPADEPLPDATGLATKMSSIVDERQVEIEESATKPTETTPPAADGNTTNTTTGTQDDIASRVLEFLGGASKETLGGIVLALSTTIYLVLGQVGLVLIGAVGGIALHAHYQSHIAGKQGQSERGTDVLQRALEWREAKKSANAMITQEMEDAGSIADGFDDFRPETAAALNEIVEATIDGYVKWWYSPILPGEESFPQTARKTLVSFLRSISRRLSKKRPADAFLDFLTNTSSIVIVFFGELAHAIKDNSDVDVAAEDAIRLYLTNNPDSNLAHIMDEKQQEKKFQLIADDLLANFINKTVYNCAPAKTFLQQIFSGVVLEMSLQTMSKPEWLNGWIVYLLEEGEPNLVQAIDAGISGESNAAAKTAPKTNGDVKGNENAKPTHRRSASKADMEMENAMKEARRLSELIAEEDMRRLKETTPVTSPPIPEEEETAPALPSRPRASALGDVPSAVGLRGGARASDEISRSSIDMSGSEQKSQFTTFDQMLLPTATPEAESPPTPAAIPPLTLHNANITIMDDSDPKDKSKLRNKPGDDYLVQIEPRDSRHPGWMIVRKYDDFETLHEVLKRIAQVSGAAAFTKAHATLPPWKGETKSNVRIGLENYLVSACHYEPLAETVGLKRFLEPTHLGPTGKSSQGLGWPSPAAFETMGKGLVDNLMSASKGAAEGGKSVFGGVTGVFTRNRSASKASMTSQNQKASRSSLSLANGPSEDKSRMSMSSSPAPTWEAAVDSIMTAEPEQIQEKKSSEQTAVASEPYADGKPKTPKNETSGEVINDMVDDVIGSEDEEKAEPVDIDTLLLPPPPSDIPDDYGISTSAPTPLQKKPATAVSESEPRQSTSSASAIAVPLPDDSILEFTSPQPKLDRKEAPPFTEEEARVALELIFAMINELYTLSSAWSLRRTLLTAAKTFLLRPGNPSLAAITEHIRSSIISSNVSDSGVAAHLRTLRANSLPTEEERKAWPEEMRGEEKEELRKRARKMLLERGVPPALRGVMGNVATGEALGVVFDGLQEGRVLRGLMFGVLLQGVRVLTH